MSDPTPKPCDWCGQIPLLKEGEAKVDPPEHYLECSNLIDCPAWPYTAPHVTQSLAIAAWNDITKPAPIPES